MSEAKRCDKCKKYFDKDDVYLELKVIAHEDNCEYLPTYFDICEECKKAFEDFLGIKKEVIKDEKE